mgnify:FL=1
MVILLILIGVILYVYSLFFPTTTQTDDPNNPSFSSVDRGLSPDAVPTATSTGLNINPFTGTDTSVQVVPVRQNTPEYRDTTTNTRPTNTSTSTSTQPVTTSTQQPQQNQPINQDSDIPAWQNQSYFYTNTSGQRTTGGTETTRNSGGDSKSIEEIDREVSGWMFDAGLGQLTGDTTMSDLLYKLTPTGATFSTVGSFFGGGDDDGGGGAGGAAIGGGAALGGAALGGGGAMTFGGMVYNITYCTCSSSILLDIQDVRGSMTSLLYTTGSSILHSFYNVTTIGVNVLGDYTPGGASCMVYAGTGCSAQGSPKGTILKIGTSP